MTEPNLMIAADDTETTALGVTAPLWVFQLWNHLHGQVDEVGGDASSYGHWREKPNHWPVHIWRTGETVGIDRAIQICEGHGLVTEHDRVVRAAWLIEGVGGLPTGKATTIYGDEISFNSVGTLETGMQLAKEYKSVRLAGWIKEWTSIQ